MDLQIFASWIAVIGTGILAAFFFGFLGYHALKKTSSGSSWLLKILETQFAATIGVPLSAISAACIVILLGVTTGGDLSFDAGFLSFKGASGPVTLWLLCFVAMIGAVRLLWRSGPAEPAKAAGREREKSAPQAAGSEPPSPRS